MERELNNLSKQNSLKRQSQMESGDQKAVSEHDIIIGLVYGVGKGKNHVFQHMLIKIASYHSVDKPLTTDSR